MKGAAAATAVICLLTTACGAVSDVQGRVITSPSAIPSIVPVSPTPQPTPLPSPSALPGAPGLPTGSCLLPFAYISEAYGWFISYPSGEKIAAPDSAVALPGNPVGAIGLNPGLSYDRVTHTWLPVPSDWVSPDGYWYAYWNSTTGAIDAVQVQTGLQEELGPTGWILFGVDDGGAYVWNDSGAWYLPFDLSPEVQLSFNKHWFAYHGGAIWRATWGNPNYIVRFDLATGTESLWGTLKAPWSINAGWDAYGNPIFIVAPGVPFTSWYRLVDIHPGGALVTFYYGTGEPVGEVYGDSHGIWFELYNGRAYLWHPGQPLRLVTSIAGNLDGPCG